MLAGMANYTATAVREAGWWVITVEGIGATQSRALADAPLMAREMIAVTLDVPLDDVAVEIVTSGASS
jgi:hypothetical protein